MNIGILGTGMVGHTLGGALADQGHRVMVGTREVATTLAGTDPHPAGVPAFSSWHQQSPSVQPGTFADAAHHGDVVIHATGGSGALVALQLAGEANLHDKILIDVSNPLDFSHGMPPSLTVCNTDSLGEQIQRTFPSAKVVKTLNTVTAVLMVNPSLVADADHTLFLCGNDADAKRQVTAWLQAWFGWREVLDLGGITNARGLEMYVPLWLRLWGALGTGVFNVKVVQ